MADCQKKCQDEKECKHFTHRCSKSEQVFEGQVLTYNLSLGQIQWSVSWKRREQWMIENITTPWPRTTPWTTMRGRHQDQSFAQSQVRYLEISQAQMWEAEYIFYLIEVYWEELWHYTFFTEPLFARHLIVGGDDMNQHLWMSDSSGKTWRKSVRLPYGDNVTSFGATLLQRRDKAS